MARKEFTAKVRVAAWQRSEGRCEWIDDDGHRCNVKLYPGDMHYDHIIADQLGGEPTLENCAVLCRSHHKAKTIRQDVPAIAKAKRRERAHLGIKPRTKFRGWRRFDGTPVYANDRND